MIKACHTVHLESTTSSLRLPPSISWAASLKPRAAPPTPASRNNVNSHYSARTCLLPLVSAIAYNIGLQLVRLCRSSRALLRRCMPLDVADAASRGVSKSAPISGCPYQLAIHPPIKPTTCPSPS
jgi:hypothetical protein